MATLQELLTTNLDPLAGTKRMQLEMLKRAGTPTTSLPAALLNGLSVGLVALGDKASEASDFNSKLGVANSAVEGAQSPAPAPSPVNQGLAAALMPKSRAYSNDEVSPMDLPVMTNQEAASGAPSFVPDQYKAPVFKAAVGQDLPPQLLASALRQESGFDPNAVSPKGAQGIGQFMPPTAREMGLSDPFNPQQAIPASAAYLRQNIDKFGGSVPQGVAAYNAGPGRVAQAGGDMSRLPAETQQYVQNVMGPATQTGAPLPPQQQQFGQAGGASPASAAVVDPLAQHYLSMANDQNRPMNERKLALGMYFQQSQKAPDYKYEKVNERLIKLDPTGRQAPTDVTPTGINNKPLTDPTERARFGIPADDKRPYQVDLTTNKLINPPAETRVNIDQRANSAFEDTYGKGMGERAIGTVNAGEKAATDVQNMRLLRNINNSISTGKLTQPGATIGAVMQAAGLDPKVLGIDPNLPARAEVFNGLANSMIMGKLGGAGGFPTNNFSNTDRDFITKGLPQLGDRPEANDLKLQTAERLANLQVEKANAWLDARNAGTSYEKFERDWNKKLSGMNLFGDLMQGMPAAGGQTAPLPSGQTSTGTQWRVVK